MALGREATESDAGPLLAIPGLPDWTRSAAFAFGDANLDNDRLFAQWWAMNKAKTLDQFKTSIAIIIGLPWVQAIATDRAGNAYYSDITVVPNVSTAKQTADIAAPFQPLVGEGLFVLAGKRFSLSTLQQIVFSNQSYYASVLLSDLLRVCAAQARAPDGTDLAAPCAVLANWDGRTELNSVG